MKKILLLAALLCTAIAFTACKTTCEIIEVTGITLAPTTAKVEIGKTTTLVATVMPANASDKTVTWATSDATVATVADGVVTGIKAGTATITATASNGDEIPCAVTVEAAAPLATEYTTAIEAGQGIAPTSGDGTEANPYLLASAENLRWLKVQNGEYGTATKNRYYKLTTDINVTTDEWIAIIKFQGHFDGDNHKVTGKLTANSSLERYFGFIGSTYGSSASIKNLKMEAEVSAPNTSIVGAVLGFVSSLEQGGNLSFIITDCTNSGKITGKGAVGGIVGNINFSNNTLTSIEHTFFDNCVNTGEIVALEYTASGIVGQIYCQPKEGINSTSVKLTIKSCRNSGKVSNTGNFTGGIVGDAAMGSGTLIVKSCTNTGIIKTGETLANVTIGDRDNKYLGLIVGGTMHSTTVISIEE